MPRVTPKKGKRKKYGKKAQAQESPPSPEKRKENVPVVNSICNSESEDDVPKIKKARKGAINSGTENNLCQPS